MRSSESVTPPPLQAVPAAPLHPAGECEGLRGVLCQVTRGGDSVHAEDT